MSAVVLRRTVSSVFLWVVIAVFGVAIFLLVRSIVHTMRHVKPVKATQPPVSAVPWGDRVFLGPGSLTHWLKVHGVAYSVWAERHAPADHLLQKQKAKLEKK
jgi:hypothetical protein